MPVSAAERHGAVTASLQRPGADAAAYYLTQSQDEAHPDRRAAYYQAEGVGVCRAEENQATGRSKSRPLKLHQARRAHL